MKNINYINSLCLLIVGAMMWTITGCQRDISDDAVEATFPKNGEVFIDGFSAGLEYFPFAGSFFEAFTVDTETKYEGSASMRFDIPNVGDPNGAYAGAIFPDNGGRDLTDFDALTFFAKATKAATLNEVGFGQDFQENKYLVTVNGYSLTTNWRKYTIPIPDPSKLTQEKGLFWYAEGPEDGEGYTMWVDEVKFEKLGTIAQPGPAIWNGEDVEVRTAAGVTTTVPELRFTSNLGSGADLSMSIAPSYYDFASSDPSVATVDELGVVTAVASGTAVITATLNGVEAVGSGTFIVGQGFLSAPVPTRDPNDVISIFSNAYTDIPVDFYNGYWAPYQTTQGQNDLNINGDDIIYYTDLNFVGIQFATDVPTVNATEMTHLHVDLQPQDEINTGDFIRIEMVDAGVDNTLGTGDDSAGSFTIADVSLRSGEWASFDIPFSDFPSLTNRANLAQVIFVSDATIEDLYVDNVYLFKGDGGGEPMEPTVAAPTPTRDAANVLSVYSDTYTDIAGTDYNPDWGQSTTYSEVQIAGNNTILYAGLNYQGTQFAEGQDVSEMEFLHIDFWTANSTALNTFLISSGPVETGSALSVPTSGWTSMDISLADFSPVDLMDVIQMKFDGSGDIYLDNIYFYKEGGGNPMMPTMAAPTPTVDAANVLSVYSDAYTDITGTDFNPDWGQSTVFSEIQVAGNNTLSYAGLNYQGIMLGSNQNVANMEFLHIDYWTANSTSLNTFIISPGPVETAKALTVPTSGWASIDIPLADFSPVDLADIFQMKFDGDGDIYLDNIYFYNNGGSNPTMPSTAAPTPTVNSADVISVYSDAYTNIPGTDYNPDWGQTTVYSEIQVAGNNTLLYGGLNYQGTMFGSSQNVSGMDFIHIDYWTANSTALNTFLISNGGIETAKVLSVPTTGWHSVDIPLADFSPVDLTDVIQMKFDGDGDIYLDNIYFYKNTVAAEPSLPMTFEDGINPVIGFDGGAFAVVADNPVMNGNSSAKVLEFHKTVGSAWYSGVVFDEALRATPIIDLADGTVFTFKIWSPNAGIQVRMQLEGGAAPAYEVFQTISTANEWVTLTFDFTSQVNTADTYPRFAIFPDFDMANQDPIAVESIYYIDDITQQ